MKITKLTFSRRGSARRQNAVAIHARQRQQQLLTDLLPVAGEGDADRGRLVNLRAVKDAAAGQHHRDSTRHRLAVAAAAVVVASLELPAGAVVVVPAFVVATAVATAAAAAQRLQLVQSEINSDDR